MDKIKIQDIITKSILEEASSDELVILENWRREADENESLYQEYLTIWNATGAYEPPVDFQSGVMTAYEKHLDLLSKEESKVVQINTSEDSKNTNRSNQSRPTTKFFSLGRIASLAALFVLVFGATFIFRTMSTTNLTATEGVMFASLEDGSSIWLDEGSTLTYKRGFGKNHRDVNLSGKAFFDVQRNENVAFNIASDDINVSVLGTSFTVDTKADKNIVSVKTGKVAVRSADKEVTVTANQKVVFENDNFTQLTAAEADAAWRNSNLSFDNAPLSQVISDINLFHADKIVLNNDIKNLDCPFTARSLANTSFENIIEILKITYDLELENQANGNVHL